MRGLSDSELLDKVLQGRRDLYLQLVHRYGPALSAVVEFYLPDPQKAEDVVVATFREAYLSLRRFGDFSRFHQELFRLAREQALQASGGKIPKEPEIQNSPFLEFTDSSAVLGQIVRWKYFEGLSYAQIASRIGASEEQVHLFLEKGRVMSRLLRMGQEALA